MNKLWIMIYTLIALAGILSGFVSPFSEKDLEGIPPIPVQGEEQSLFSLGTEMVGRIFWHNFKIDMMILLFSFGGLHIFFWFINTKIIGWLLYLVVIGDMSYTKMLWAFPTLFLELIMWILVLHYGHSLFMGSWKSDSFRTWRTNLIKNYGRAYTMLIVIGIPLTFIAAIVETVSLLYVLY